MSPKPVVVLVSGKDPLTQRGGHPSFVRAHGRAAIAAGFVPHIFCASPEAGPITTDFGVVHRARGPWKSSRQTMMPFLAHRLTSAVTRFLSDQPGPHLIHSFSTWGAVGVAVEQKLRRRGIEAVTVVSAYTTMRHEGWGKVCGLNKAYSFGQHLFTQREYLWIRAAIVPYERVAYQRSRLVLINYDSVQEMISAEFGSRLPFRKIPYASESAFCSPEDGAQATAPESLAALRPREAPLIVAVSRHDLRKGLDVLLRSLARLKKAGVAFRACLVGPGVLLARHRRLAAELDLTGSLMFTGDVPDSLPYLIHADIFVLPSLEEGSGSLSLLEALQTRNACVVSNCDGLVEDVTDGHDALLVPPGDEPSLAAALRRLLEDRELRSRLSAAARETFEKRFSAAALTRALCGVYRELLP